MTDDDSFIFLKSPDKSRQKAFVKTAMKEVLGTDSNGYPGIRIHLAESLFRLSESYVKLNGKAMSEPEFDRWTENHFDPMVNYMISFARETRSPHKKKEKEFLEVLKKVLRRLNEEALALDDHFTSLLCTQAMEELS